MSKHAFWQALIFAVIIFCLGLILGYFLESRQSEDIYSRLVDSELNILDEQLRQRIISDNNVSCSIAKDSLFSFADKIYSDASLLEEIDGTGRLGDLMVLHRRYDLLRTLLFMEANNLKGRCGEDFHVITYFYLYNNEDVDVSSRQNYFSRLAFDLKTDNREKIVLIPIAVDTNVESVEVLVKSIDLRVYPAILIDGEEIVTDLITLDEFSDLVFGNNNTSMG